MSLSVHTAGFQAQAARMSDPDDLGFLGFWHWDVATGIVNAGKDINRLFGQDSDADGVGVPVGEYMGRIHRDDVEWLSQERSRCFGPSGHGVLEYRVISGNGDIHWVMSRALYETAEGGELVRAHGMLIDVTRFKADGNTAQVAPATLPNPLQSLVDATLESHRAAVQVGEPGLVRAVEAVLMRAGKLLALQLGRSEVIRVA